MNEVLGRPPPTLKLDLGIPQVQRINGRLERGPVAHLLGIVDNCAGLRVRSGRDIGPDVMQAVYRWRRWR